MGRGDLKKADRAGLCQCFHSVGEADAAGCDSQPFLIPVRIGCVFPGRGRIGCAVCRVEDPVSLISRELVSQSDIALLDQLMVLIGKPWEDHPLRAVLDEAFRAVHRIFRRILNGNGRVSVADSCGWPKEDGSAVFF